MVYYQEWGIGERNGERENPEREKPESLKPGTEKESLQY